MYCLSVFLALILWCISRVQPLELYLAPSKVPGAGQGLFTMQDIPRGSRLDDSYSVLLDDYMTQEINLINYVYQSPFDHYAAMLFGSAVLINHQPTQFSNIERFWDIGEDNAAPSMPTNALRPYTLQPSMTFVAKRDIAAGEELFVTYGEDAYFAERFTTSTYGSDGNGFDAHTYQYSALDLRRQGHTLSTINVNLSSIAMAGRGAFSKLNTEQDGIVAISPALVVPEHLFMESGRECVIINYCISAADTDVALLPLGLAAMMNHGGTAKSNVAIRWFDWDGRSPDAIFADLTAEGLAGFGGTPLYLEYYATRPISVGEELLLDYGAEWESAWRRYLDVMSVWMSREGEDGASLLHAPQFRYPITSPAGMFPAIFEQLRCIGTSDCKSPNKRRRPSATNVRFNKVGRHYRMDADTIRRALAAAGSEWESSPVGPQGEFDQKDVHIIDPAELRCGMYLAPVDNGSKLSKKQATGVFAGVSIKKSTPVEGSVTALVRKELLRQSSLLAQYAANSSRINYDLIYFGFGAHMRECADSNIGSNIMAKNNEDVPLPSFQASRPYSTYENIIHFSSTNISPGAELLLSINEKLDFVGQKSPLKTISYGSKPTEYSLQRLQKIGHCLTHVYIEPSQLPSAGKGVYTESGYVLGAQVSISQALVLPKHLLIEDDSSPLINYCISAADTDVALLPLGQAAMMNHGGTAKSNVAIRWFDWDGRSPDAIFADLTAEGLAGFGGTPLYLEYYATRPISVGEELLLDYGAEWESAWRRYLDVMSVWMSREGEDGASLLHAPQFRYPITSPAGMFPAIFKKRCFGSPFCSAKGKIRTSTYIETKLSLNNATAVISQDNEVKVKITKKQKASKHSRDIFNVAGESAVGNSIKPSAAAIKKSGGFSSGSSKGGFFDYFLNLF